MRQHARSANAPLWLGNLNGGEPPSPLGAASWRAELTASYRPLSRSAYAGRSVVMIVLLVSVIMLMVVVMLMIVRLIVSEELVL